MKILFLLIGVSLLLALGFLAAFFWAIRRGQHDDLYTPSLRMLIEDEAPGESSGRTESPLCGGLARGPKGGAEGCGEEGDVRPPMSRRTSPLQPHENQPHRSGGPLPLRPTHYPTAQGGI